jgi:hypothetical protein
MSLKTSIIYVPTNEPDISVAMAEASTQAGNYMKKHWTSDYDDIRDTYNLESTAGSPPLKEMGGKYGAGNVIMISRNLGNSGHIDNADNRCFLGGRGTRQSQKLGVHYPGRRNQLKPGCCDQTISRSSCFVGREENPALLLNTKAWC